MAHGWKYYGIIWKSPGEFSVTPQKLAHEPGDNGAEHQGEAKIRLCQNNTLHCVKDFLARLTLQSGEVLLVLSNVGRHCICGRACLCDQTYIDSNDDVGTNDGHPIHCIPEIQVVPGRYTILCQADDTGQLSNFADEEKEQRRKPNYTNTMTVEEKVHRDQRDEAIVRVVRHDTNFNPLGIPALGQLEVIQPGVAPRPPSTFLGCERHELQVLQRPCAGLASTPGVNSLPAPFGTFLPQTNASYYPVETLDVVTHGHVHLSRLVWLQAIKVKFASCKSSENGHTCLATSGKKPKRNQDQSPPRN